MLSVYFSNKYGILYVGSRMYEITYNITKKGRVAARPFSYIIMLCILEIIKEWNI